MAQNRPSTSYSRPVKRLISGVLVICLLLIFLIWRIDSPRVERFRIQLVDHVVPNMDWAMRPLNGLFNLTRDFQSYQRIQQQNIELKRELQQMKAWREAALQLEQENARLLDLNNVQLDPKFTFITGVVLADSGSPFRQSVLLNVGERDGIIDGWAVMDGLGLVGRVSGVGQDTSRVVLLTDTASQVPVTIKPSGQTAILMGDNTTAPTIELLDKLDQVRPGDRIVTSGNGGVFPADLLIGQLARDPNGRLRARLSADYERLEFLRVVRTQRAKKITGTGDLIPPVNPPDANTQEDENGS